MRSECSLSVSLVLAWETWERSLTATATATATGRTRGTRGTRGGTTGRTGVAIKAEECVGMCDAEFATETDAEAEAVEGELEDQSGGVNWAVT